MVKLRMIRHGRRRKIADYTLGDLKKQRRRIKHGDYGATDYWGAQAKGVSVKEYADWVLKNKVQLLHFERKVPALEHVEIRKAEVEKQRTRLKINKLGERIERLEESGEATPGQIRKLESEFARLARERNAIASRLDRLRKENLRQKT